jgi:threonine/homoserine/homoserine lactone efflux protein
MHALFEYAKLAGQRVPLRAPESLPDVLRWVGVLLLAWLAIRLIGAVLRGFRM